MAAAVAEAVSVAAEAAVSVVEAALAEVAAAAVLEAVPVDMVVLLTTTDHLQVVTTGHDRQAVIMAVFGDFQEFQALL